MIILSIDVGIKNLAYCLLKVENNEVFILDWNNLSLCEDNENSKKINLIHIGSNLQLKLDNIFETKWNNIGVINNIIIENQLGKNAVRMKTLQGMITQYFIQKKISTVEHWCATNKLKLFSNISKTTYNERKKFAIKICLEITKKHFNFWEDFFNNHKKKDDLSDSLLQGLHYIVKNNLSNIFNNADYLKL